MPQARPKTWCTVRVYAGDRHPVLVNLSPRGRLITLGHYTDGEMLVIGPMSEEEEEEAITSIPAI